jgi:hypothetical protein
MPTHEYNIIYIGTALTLHIYIYTMSRVCRMKNEPNRRNSNGATYYNNNNYYASRCDGFRKTERTCTIDHSRECVRNNNAVRMTGRQTVLYDNDIIRPRLMATLCVRVYTAMWDCCGGGVSLGRRSSHRRNNNNVIITTSLKRENTVVVVVGPAEWFLNTRVCYICIMYVRIYILYVRGLRTK